MAEINGSRIKELRKELNLSQDQLAQKIGVARQAVNSYETGKRNPEMAALMRLATELSCTTDFLLGLSNNRTNDLSIDEDNLWEILKDALKKHGEKTRQKAVKAFVKLLDSVANCRINPYKDKLLRLSLNAMDSRAEYNEFISNQTEIFAESLDISDEKTAKMFVEMHDLNNQAMDWEREITNTGIACMSSYFPAAYAFSKNLYGIRPTNADKEDAKEVIRASRAKRVRNNTITHKSEDKVGE